MSDLGNRSNLMRMAAWQRRLAILSATYFIARLFFNDVTNFGSIDVGFNLRPDRIVLIIIVMAYTGRALNAPVRQRIDGVEFWSFVVAAIMIGSAYRAGTLDHPSNRYISTVFNFVVFPTVFYATARRLEFDERTLRNTLAILVAAGAYLGATGIFEHMFPSLVFPKYILDPGLGIHLGRSRGPFLQAAVFGSALSLLFALAMYYYVQIERHPLVLVSMGLMFASVYLSNTRSAWIQLALTVAVFGISHRIGRRFLFLGLILILVIYLSGILDKFSIRTGTLFSSRQGPIDDRKNIMLAALRMFLDKPLTGFGYGTFEAANDAYFVEIPGIELRGDGEGNHNTLLGILAEMGIVGFVPYALVYWKLTRDAFHNAREAITENARVLALVQLAMLAGFLLQMQLIDVRFFVFLNGVVYFVAGCAAAYARMGPAATSDEGNGTRP